MYGDHDDPNLPNEEPYEEQPFGEGPYEEAGVGDYDPSYLYDEELYETEYEEPYVEPEPVPPPKKEAEVISTNQTVCLTATLASLSGLMGLFLCFADQRSRAIRRFSVQSVGLLVIHVAVLLVTLLLVALLGWIPLAGAVFRALFWTLFAAATAVVVFFRVRMMFHAYRGEAYVLPVMGESIRRFE